VSCFLELQQSRGTFSNFSPALPQFFLSLLPLILSPSPSTVFPPCSTSYPNNVSIVSPVINFSPSFHLISLSLHLSLTLPHLPISMTPQFLSQFLPIFLLLSHFFVIFPQFASNFVPSPYFSWLFLSLSPSPVSSTHLPQVSIFTCSFTHIVPPYSNLLPPTLAPQYFPSCLSSFTPSISFIPFFSSSFSHFLVS